MLQMRARGLACRDGAADALSGLYLAEEMEDADTASKRKSSNSAKKDGTNETFNEIRKHIKDAYGDGPKLQQIRDLYAKEWDEMPSRWVEILNEEFEDAMESSRPQEAAE